MLKAHYNLNRVRRNIKTGTHRKSIRKKINKVNKKVNALIKGVMRQDTDTTAMTAITQAGVPSNFPAMTVGDGDNQREGNSINVHSIDCRCHVKLLNGASMVDGTAFLYRMIIGVDKQPNLANPDVNTLLNNSANNANNYLAPFNLNAKNRFRILFDRTYVLKPLANTMEAVGAGSNQDDSKYIHFRRNFKTPITVRYNNGNTGAVGDIISNNIFMLEFASGNVAIEARNITTLRYEA